jgi:hypothetical protein
VPSRRSRWSSASIRRTPYSSCTYARVTRSTPAAPRLARTRSPVVSLTRLQGSLNAAARALAPSEEALETPLSPPPLDDEPGPATGRSGAYPDRTLTCKPGPAFRTQHEIHSMAGILIGVKSAYAGTRLFEPARAPNRLPRAGNDERLGSREAGSRCSPPMGTARLR